MAETTFQLALHEVLERLPQDFAGSDSRAEFLVLVEQRMRELQALAGSADDLYAMTSGLERVLARLGVVNAGASRILPSDRRD